MKHRGQIGDEVIAFGMHAVRHALSQSGNGNRLQGMLLLQAGRKDSRLMEIARLAEAHGLGSRMLPRKEMDQLVSGPHQGVILTGQNSAASAEDLEALLQGLQESPFLLVLDGVEDPHNLGACLRSADAAGVHAVVVPRRRATGRNATVRKVAAGGAEHVPLVVVTNLARSLRALQDRGIRVVGLTGEAANSIYETELTGPLALVMGGENKGLRRLTREHCDCLASLPMAGHVESLNVSVAAGISLYEALRQRAQGGGRLRSS